MTPVLRALRNVYGTDELLAEALGVELLSLHAIYRGEREPERGSLHRAFDRLRVNPDGSVARLPLPSEVIAAEPGQGSLGWRQGQVGLRKGERCGKH